MKWALVKDDNKIDNIIVYSPPLPTDSPEDQVKKTFLPPHGITLRQINDWLDIGDDADAPQPQT